MHQDNEGSVRQHILYVTMDLINKEGFEAVTVRKVASLADVNIAMINYYFGSKENLMNEAVQTIISTLQKSFNVLYDENMTPRERLKAFLVRYAKGLQTYPALVRRVIAQEAIGFETQSDFIGFMKNMGLIQIMELMEEITGETDATKQSMMSMQLIGAMAFPFIMQPILQKIIDTLPYDSYETYINLLLEQYFG